MEVLHGIPFFEQPHGFKLRWIVIKILKLFEIYHTDKCLELYSQSISAKYLELYPIYCESIFRKCIYCFKPGKRAISLTILWNILDEFNDITNHRLLFSNRKTCKSNQSNMIKWSDSSKVKTHFSSIGRCNERARPKNLCFRHF